LEKSSQKITPYITLEKRFFQKFTQSNGHLRKLQLDDINK